MLDRPLTTDETAVAPSPEICEDPQRRLSREEVQWLMHGSGPAAPLGATGPTDTYSATPEHGPARPGLPQRAFQFPDLRPGRGGQGPARGAHEVELRVELGRRPISPDEAASLGPGQLVSLQDSNHLVSLYAGERFVATGELIIQDERLCVRVVELPGDAFLGVSARRF